MSEASETSLQRRAAILDAAAGVFLRYGFKKTSMDDLARAAGLSRQGLYLHFPTKEAIFKAGLLRLIEGSRALGRAALARTDLSVEERVLEMFVSVRAQLVGMPGGAEQMNELLEAARQVVGDAGDALTEEQVGDLARVLRTEGIAAAWKDAGLSAKQLADQLMNASYGIKQRTHTLDEYRERMRVAVRIVCGGQAAR